MVSFLDCLAYLLIPGNPLCKFFWIYGASQAGKSILMKLLKIIFGDYGAEIDSNSITAHSRPNQEVRPDLLKLVDKKFIVCSETEKTKKLDSRLIKTITGGDILPVRLSHSNNFSELKIDGKMFFVSNFPPIFVNPDDEAIRERAVIIDWHNTVPENRRILDLVEQLTTDEMRSWIFSALLHRANDLYKRGCVLNINPDFVYYPLQEPCNINNLKNQIFEEFCNECIIIEDLNNYPMEMIERNYAPAISGIDIHRAYVSYCHLRGYFSDVVIFERAFVMRFRDYMVKLSKDYPYIKKVRSSNGNFYKGINLVHGLIPYLTKFPNNGKYIYNDNPCFQENNISESISPDIAQNDFVE